MFYYELIKVSDNSVLANIQDTNLTTTEWFSGGSAITGVFSILESNQKMVFKSKDYFIFSPKDQSAYDEITKVEIKTDSTTATKVFILSLGA